MSSRRIDLRFAFALTLLMAVAGGAHAQAFPPGFVHPRPAPEAPPYSGPLRPGEAAPGWYAVRSGEWELTPDILEQLQVATGQAAGRSLDNYRIQYRGSLQYGHRSVLVSGYCRRFFLTERDLVDGIVVMDGGACFFDGRYDVEQQRFTHFSFHGQA